MPVTFPPVRPLTGAASTSTERLEQTLGLSWLGAEALFDSEFYGHPTVVLGPGSSPKRRDLDGLHVTDCSVGHRTGLVGPHRTATPNGQKWRHRAGLARLCNRTQVNNNNHKNTSNMLPADHQCAGILEETPNPDPRKLYLG